MTVMTLVGTFVGVKLMGLTTLPTVEKMQAEGFTEIEYNTWMYDRWLDLDENNEEEILRFPSEKGRAELADCRRPQGRSACADYSGGGLMPLAEIGNFV